MALMYAKYPGIKPIAKAVRLVMDRQLPVRLFFFLRVIDLIF